MKAGLTFTLLAKLVSFFRVTHPKKVGWLRKICPTLAFSAILLLGYSTNTGATIINTGPLLPGFNLGSSKAGDATLKASNRTACSNNTGLAFGPEICNNGIDDDGDGLVDANDPDCCSSLSSLSKTGWSLLYKDSEETVGENGAATNAFDGDINTIWHTKWYYSNDPLPHEIQIDLGSSQSIGGFRYWPRQTGVNGRIGDYQFYLSSDGTNWGSPIVAGAWTYSGYGAKEVQFAVTTARYIRLRATSEAYGNVWTSASEIDVLACVIPEVCNNGIDDDGDGLVDCADSDCNATSYATAVASQSGVVNPNNALGAPDDIPAKLYDNNDQMVLDFGTAQPAGTTFTIRWQSASHSYPTVAVEESSNGSTFSAVADSPFLVNSTTFFNKDITVSASTQYLRFINTNNKNTDLDAVTVVTCLVEICGNGIDDDGDGLIDCADGDCSLSLAANAGPGVSICTGGSTTLAASATGGASPYTFAWSNSLGSGASKTVSPASTTTYTVTVTSASACTATSQVLVTVVAGTAISVQPVGFTECTGGAQALTVSGTGGTPSLTYQWQSSTNNSSFNNISGATTASYTPPATVPGTNYYRVSLTASGSGCGSVTSNSATVVVVANPAISTQPASATICTGGAQTLSVTATGGAPSLTYQWQSSTDNVTFANISGATLGSYTTPALTSTKYYRVVVSASGIGCGSVTSNSATVTVAAPPSVTTSSNVSICPGSNTTISASGAGSSPFTFAWSNGLGSGASKTVNPSSTTTYSVTVTDNKGCTATGQVTVMVGNPPTVTTSSNVVICSGTSTAISASATGAGPFSYLWGNGLGSGATNTVTPSATTVYSVTVTDVNGCTATNQVTVTVNQTPAANAGADVTICKFFSTTLTASATGGTTPYSFAWSDGLGSGATKIVTPLATKTYTVTVTSANGCLSTDQVTVTVQQCSEICGNGLDDDGDGLTDCADSNCGPTATLSQDVTICLNKSTTLTASASGGTGILTYLWSHNLGTGISKTVTPAATTTYSVTVTVTASGCTDVANVTVTVVPCSENCTNGIDDDGDGLVDCDDPDCLGITAPILNDDEYTTCPALPFSERVTYNDGNLLNPGYSIFAQPASGMVTIDGTGKFYFTPFGAECTSDVFIYQVCNGATGCCSTATVTINFGDATPPVLTNVPADITISCDDAVPVPGIVTAYDQCPGIYVEFEESSGQNAAGACESYNITRTWTATDLCGNVATAQQTISVVDLTKPEIFRVYTLGNGAKLIAGVSQRVTHVWKYVPFPVTLGQVPVILTQVNSADDFSAVNVRQRNISTQGFEIRLREEQAADGKHGPESVAWIAIEPGNQGGAFTFEAGTLANVNHVLQDLNFTQAFSSVPLVISSIQSTNDNDPVNLRHASPNNSSLQLYLQEETSGDAEIAHLNEIIGFMAIQPGSVLKDKKNTEFGEPGLLSLTNAWATVLLNKKYTKPVVVFGGVSNNDTEPVNVRVRNVTATSFEVRLQEWDYLDGNHSTETVSWMVVEGSIPGDKGYYCSGLVSDLQPGVNVFALDNCDAQVAFNFDETQAMQLNGMLTTRTWTAADDCGNLSLVTRYDTCSVAAVKIKALLIGATIGSSNANGLMRDDLRVKNLVPEKEPFSKMPAYPHVVDKTPGYNGGNSNNAGNGNDDKITICHKPGTSAQKTKLVTPSSLAAHLAHGDVLGACSGGSADDLSPGALASTYRTIADGNWTDGATWAGGLVPPTGDVKAVSISIEHNVVLQSASILLKNDSKLWITNGSLTFSAGNFIVDKASVVIENSTLTLPSTAGDVQLTHDKAEFKAFNSEINIGQNFQNMVGLRWLENVCLNVDGQYSASLAGIDTLINVNGVVGQGLINNTGGSMYFLDTKIKVQNGDFENKLGAYVKGENLLLLIENGNLSNLGSWTAAISQYCVSGLVTVPLGFLPASEGCTNIAGNFDPSGCSVSQIVTEPTGENTNYLPVNNSGIMEPALLDVEGKEAIVDWMLVELRNPANEAEILAYATAILERDGNLVTETGDSVLVFPDAPEGNYYISIRHRNHLGIMTDVPFYLSTMNVPEMDFTDLGLPVRGGTGAGRVQNGRRALWPGDFNGDGKVIYQGPFNDVFFLFSRVLADPANGNMLANFIIQSYDPSDLNLDGKVIYQGPNNDRATLLYNSILVHPGNTSLLANFILQDLVP